MARAFPAPRSRWRGEYDRKWIVDRRIDRAVDCRLTKLTNMENGKGHDAIPCTVIHRNEQTRIVTCTQCRTSSGEEMFSIPRLRVHNDSRTKRHAAPQTPEQSTGTMASRTYVRTIDIKLAYLLLSLGLRRLAQERLVLLLASVVPLVLSLEKPTQSTYVRLRNHVESRSGNRNTPEKQQRRVLRGPAEALVHRVVLR